MNLKQKIRYILDDLSFFKIYASPFRRPKLKFYFGKIAIGTPYFYPRRWVKSKDRPGYSTPVPKRFGFDLVTLGWKTKWSSTDYRFEWSPLLSFVFLKWQIAVMLKVPETSHYWECWLHYSRNTDKSKSVIGRLDQAKKDFPCNWVVSKDGKSTKVDYWQLVVKNKYLKV